MPPSVAGHESPAREVPAKLQIQTRATQKILHVAQKLRTLRKAGKFLLYVWRSSRFYFVNLLNIILYRMSNAVEMAEIPAARSQKSSAKATSHHSVKTESRFGSKIDSRRSGKTESRRSGKTESVRSGKSDSRRSGRSESRRSGKSDSQHSRTDSHHSGKSESRRSDEPKSEKRSTHHS